MKSFLEVQLQTKRLTIYFSDVVLNNELFFANDKRLSIFVNKTMVILEYELISILIFSFFYLCLEVHYDVSLT